MATNSGTLTKMARTILPDMHHSPKESQHEESGNLTRGNIAKYAPSTPEIAPDAPTAGMELVGSITMWARPAPTPHAR